jgi:hypothetical protein
MQPQLKSKVRCTDREIGEVTKVIVDPLSREISHIVVSMNGSGERQVSMALVQTITDDAVQLRNASSEVAALPPFKRDEYLSTHEVEIAHLEDNLHVTPGEVLVPFPELEKDVKRRTFFMNFTHAIGFLIGLPIAFPVLRYLMKPMYAPLDNGWLKIGNVSKIKTDDIGVQFKYKKHVKEVYLPEAEVEKNVVHVDFAQLEPFELVAVSTDTRMQDVLDYEAIISRTVPTRQRFVQLWAGDSGYRDNLGQHAQLPAGYLVDKSGKIVERYLGRIPPEAWDRIADLL